MAHRKQSEEVLRCQIRYPVSCLRDLPYRLKVSFLILRAAPKSIKLTIHLDRHCVYVDIYLYMIYMYMYVYLYDRNNKNKPISSLKVLVLGVSLSFQVHFLLTR